MNGKLVWKRIALQIKELVPVRDRMNEWLLERGKWMILLIIFVLSNAYVCDYMYLCIWKFVTMSFTRINIR